MRQINALLRSPIRLPEGRVGAFAVQHNHFKPDAGPVAVVGLREAFLTGRRPVAARLTEPLLVHELVQFDEADKLERVWMTDEPQELRQAAEWIVSAQPHGRVLVGGLGLGVVASWLAQRPAVTQVLVVERSPEVVRLVQPHQRGYDVLTADIHQYVRTTTEWPWDFAFLDTWQGTNERTWWEEVMPLRRTIANRFGRRRVACWAEPFMLGQVELFFQMSQPETRARLGVEGPTRGWYYTAFPADMDRAAVRAFTANVGLPSWERRFGKIVDAGCRQVAANRAAFQTERSEP